MNWNSLLLTIAALAAVTASFAADPVVEVIQDHPDGLYTCGEVASFSVRLLDADGNPHEATVAYTLTLDGSRQLGTGEVQAGAEPGVITGTLDEPGVIQCSASAELDGKRIYGLGAAAFDPEQIVATTPDPEDFDEWWASQKALLAAIPMDAQLEERRGAEGASRVYKVSLANVDGRRTYGWQALPDVEGPVPAVMTFTAPPLGGAGYGTATSLAQHGFLSMHIIHHNFDVELPAEEAAALKEGELATYYRDGADSRDTYYFRHVILGCVRAIDLLTSRPEWEGENHVVTGSSQAGGL